MNNHIIFKEKGRRDMALSEARKKANEKWNKENYKQVKLSMPNEEAETLKKYCEIKECTVAGFIRQAVKEKMEREPVQESTIEVK